MSFPIRVAVNVSINTHVIRGPPSKALDMLIAGSRWLVAGDERIVSKEKAGAIAERQRR
jgi:hypothetical protein